MKFRSLLLIFAALLPLCISCSDDAEVNNFTGDYKGYVVLNANYFKNLIVFDRTVTISPDKNDAYITLDNVNFGAMKGSFSAKLKVESVNDKIFRLSGDGVATLTMGGAMGAGAETKEYNCNVLGSVTSIGNKNLNLVFSMPDVMGGMKVEFSQGDVPDVEALVRAYSGEAIAVADEFPQGITSPKELLEITEEERDNAGNHVFLVSMQSAKFGKFSAKTAKVLHDKDIYTFTGTGECELNMEEAPAGKYKVQLSGTVNLREPAKTEIVFTMPEVLNSLTVRFFNIPQ